VKNEGAIVWAGMFGEVRRAVFVDEN